MSMQTISWEEYIKGTGDQGSGIRGGNSNNNPRSPLPTPHSLPLAVTVGVFDGVHLGHQALICQLMGTRDQGSPAALSAGIRESGSDNSIASGLYPNTSNNNPRSPVPGPQSPLFPDPRSPIPTVVTFKQNPLSILKPDTFAGDILNLEQKLAALEFFGVKLAVLIDFSGEFCKMNGRDFIDLLLGCRPVKLMALGGNFRCGHGLDTGVDEIRSLAAARGVETRVAADVMDDGRPVSSSRIRQALADGRIAEAERLLGRPFNSCSQ